jgi:kynurenine formamidase
MILLALTWSQGGAGDKALQTKAAMNDTQVLDLSLLVASEYPCTWPADWFPLFHINHFRRIGPASAYNIDVLSMDGNCGTQLDFPPHSVALPASGLPNAGPYGTMFGDKVPAWQFGGEACVIDVRALCDSGPKGRSDLIKKEHVIAWEKKHRPLGPGDVVLFYSGYTDKYYKPLPEGRRFLADPLDGKAPAWPDPEPDCMEYLASRKVMTLGCDSPSMGPIPDLAEPTHYAGLKYGMIWTEGATGLGKLPPTGAFYCSIGPKHVGSPYSEARAFAVLPSATDVKGKSVAGRLIDAARKKNVVDLSTPLSADLPVWWPGAGSGENRHAYFRVLFTNYRSPSFTHETHLFDSQTGTHLVPPAYALPPKGFDDKQYPPQIRQWLAEYEKKYGPRGLSAVTADNVPLAQTCGTARIIDVKRLIGTTNKAAWPASPEIKVADIKQYEGRHGALNAGDIVIFHSGYSDTHFKPFPKGNTCMVDPLSGKSEGWPAPGPDAIVYLAEKGIRCVATDGPTLGGVDPKRALWTCWALGGKNMVGVEYLINVGSLADRSYFLFASTKVRDCHGGPGRALGVVLGD